MDDQIDSGVSAGSDASPAAPPAAAPASSDQTTAAVPDTGTASVAPDPAGPESATPAIGPIPYDRFKQVNTRMQTAEQRVREIQEQYGDMLGMPASQVKELLTFARQMRQDPIATWQQLSDGLISHPVHGQQMTSAAARWLQARRGQGPGATPAPEPEPDLVAENGQPVYSAPRLREWKAWADKQTEARISQRLEPLERDARTRQEERQQADIRQKADAEAGALLEKAKSWHGFEAHQESITKAFREHPDWDLKDAYMHVLHTEILPALPAQAQSAVVAQLQQKAAAQTMNPATASTGPKPDFGGDFTKALNHFAGKK